MPLETKNTPGSVTLDQILNNGAQGTKEEKKKPEKSKEVDNAQIIVTEESPGKEGVLDPEKVFASDDLTKEIPNTASVGGLIESADNTVIENQEPENTLIVQEEKPVVENSKEIAPLQAPLPAAPPEVPLQGAETQSPSLVTAKFGTTVPRFPINRFKASKGIVYRGSFISEDIFIAKLHYAPGMGSIFCFGGACCENLGMPNVRYLMPWLLYTTNEQGKPISREFDIQYLQRSEDQYLTLVGWHNAGMDIFKTDFIITCADEQYQKLDIQNVGPAVWANPQNQMQDAVKTKLGEVWKFVGSVVGRTIDEQLYFNLMEGAQGAPKSSSVQPTALKGFLKG